MDYDRHSLFEETILHLPDLSRGWGITEDTYHIIPTPVAKFWIWEANLRDGRKKEVNEFAVVCFVLALRYFKNYKVKISPISEETIRKMNRMAINAPVLTHTIYLQDEILAFVSASGMFYTNSVLLANHKKTLGFYCDNLKEAPFCMRLNAAEKHLFCIWLSYVKYLNQKSQETVLRIIRQLITDLEPCGIRFERFVKEHYFCNELEGNCLPAGMAFTVFQYEKNYVVSDLFIEDTSEDNMQRYIFLDQSIIDNYNGKDSLTILNHIRYFDLYNRVDPKEDLLWVISHNYRQKVDSSIQFIRDTKQYFLGEISRIKKDSIKGSIISEDNLLLNRDLYFFPFQQSILNIYHSNSLKRHVKLILSEKQLQLLFTWRLSQLEVVSSITYQLDKQVKDLPDTLPELELVPQYNIKELEYYTLRYKSAGQEYSLAPIRYDGKTDNCYSSRYPMALHGLYKGFDFCGFFITEYLELDHSGNEDKVEVKLSFYTNRVIYDYHVERADGEVLTRKEIHDFDYHWDFDGGLLFGLSEKDIQDVVWNIFIELLSKGYHRDNISWSVFYHAIREKVNNRIFEQFIKSIISESSLLKKLDTGKLTDNDKYEARMYSTYHMNFDQSRQLMKKMADEACCDMDELQLIYMSDPVFYEDTLLPDLSIQARNGNRNTEGLLSILKLIGHGGSGILELCGLEFFKEDFFYLNNEMFGGLTFRKMQNIAFRLDHPRYDEITRELIYLITCLMLCAVNQICGTSSVNKKTKHLVINFDLNSILYRMIKLMPCYTKWLGQFGKMIIDSLNIESVYIGEDFLVESYVQIRRREDGFQKPEKANIELLLSPDDNPILQGDNAFAEKADQALNKTDFGISREIVRKQYLENPSYIRDHYSRMKNQVIKNYFETEYESDTWISYQPFLGNKQLCFIKSGLAKADQKTIDIMFDMVNWGNQKDNSNSILILLLPAVVESDKLIEKGAVIVMDTSLFIEIPEISDKDFLSLNNESAKTAATVTRHMFQTIDQSFYLNNLENQKIISQQKAEIEKDNDLREGLQKYVSDLNIRIQKLEAEKLKLENEHSFLKEENHRKDIRISYLEKNDYNNTIVSDFNKYLYSGDKLYSFFKKYKKNCIIAEIDNNQIRFKHSFFQSGDKFMIIETAPDKYMVFPDKDSLNYQPYEDTLKRIYTIELSRSYIQGYTIIKPAILIKQGSYYVPFEYGVIQTSV